MHKLPVFDNITEQEDVFESFFNLEDQTFSCHVRRVSKQEDVLGYCIEIENITGALPFEATRSHEHG